jgi:predicted MPP superfamily phosphohydrolase
MDDMPISPFEDDPPSTGAKLPLLTRKTAAQLWLIMPMVFVASAGLGMWPEYILGVFRTVRRATSIDITGAFVVAVVFIFGGVGGLLGGIVAAWFAAQFTTVALGLLTVAVVLPTQDRLRRALPWLVYGTIAAVAVVYCTLRYARWWTRVPDAVTIGSGIWLAGVVIGTVVCTTTFRAAVHEFRIGTISPVLPFLDVPTLQDDTLIVAHLSDLHLAASANEERVEGGASGNVAFAQIFAAKSQLLAAHVVLITGDITDGGRKDEWRSFFDAYPTELLSRTIIIPGNHDVNFTDTARPGLTDEGATLRDLRLARMLAAMNLVQGERAMVLDENTELITLREHVQRYERAFDTLRHQVRGETTAKASVIADAWNGAFPQVVSLGEAVFFLLDSNPRPFNIIDNAIGEVSPQQLARLQILQKQYAAKSFVYVLHHHVGLPEKAAEWAGRLQIRLLRLRNARDFLAVVPSDRQVIVFHGHRHFGYIGRYQDRMAIVSASSSTLGDESEYVAVGEEQFAHIEFFGIRAADGDSTLSRGSPMRISLGPRLAARTIPFWQKIDFAAQLVRGETLGVRDRRSDGA